MLYEFGPFQLDPAERVLRRETELLSLTPKAFDTLVVLVANAGRLVEKETLFKIVWKDTFVEESTLAQNIFTLRKTLGESAGQRFIETIPKRGYRFVAPVKQTAGGNAAAPLLPEIVPPGRFWKKAAVPALLAALLVAGGLGLLRQNGETPHEGSPPATIAVLPFKSLSGNSSDEYLGVAMADALITRLGGFRRMTVRPTTAVHKYAGGRQDAVSAGRELRVQMVLNGTILRAGDRVRLTVHLYRVADGISVWRERFDVPFADIFTVQDQVSERVAQQMRIRLSSEEQRQLLVRHTNDPKAYEAYLKGRFFWNKRTEEGHVRAIQHFEEALKLDADFARAWSGLADAYALLGSMPNNAVPRDVAMPRARDAAVRALEIDEGLAEAHTSLGWVKLHYEWDFEKAGREFTRALELNPAYPTAHHWRSYYFLAVGNAVEAVASSRRAEALDPVSMIISTDVAEMLYYAGRYDDSIAQIRKTLEMDPHYALANRLLALNLLQKGRFDEALAAGQRSVQGGREDQLGLIARVEAKRGNLDAARNALSDLEQSYPRRFVLAQSIAAAYVGVGNKERALEMLEEAFRQRDGGLILLRVEPAWDGLRSDERFIDLMRRVGVLR